MPHSCASNEGAVSKQAVRQDLKVSTLLFCRQVSTHECSKLEIERSGYIHSILSRVNLRFQIIQNPAAHVTLIEPTFYMIARHGCEYRRRVEAVHSKL